MEIFSENTKGYCSLGHSDVGDYDMIIGDMELNGVQFEEALYHSHCADCNNSIDWEADFDADGTRYTGQCCGYYYRISEPKTVDVWRF